MDIPIPNDGWTIYNVGVNGRNTLWVLLKILDDEGYTYNVIDCTELYNKDYEMYYDMMTDMMNCWPDHLRHPVVFYNGIYVIYPFYVIKQLKDGVEEGFLDY